MYTKEQQLAAQRKHYANNKEYYANRNVERKAVIRDYIRAAKNVPCMDCGVIYPYYVMDFDHRGDKEFDISLAVGRGMSLQRIQLEIDKCDVVCANCHRERTHRQ